MRASPWIRRHSSELVVLLIGLGLIGWRFFPALLWGKTLVFGDNFSLSVPGKIYTVYWLKQGVIPWWNAAIFGGIPWAHEISQSCLYPSTLFFWWLNPAAALNLTIAAHLWFTFIGMYLLGKTWFKDVFLAGLGAVLWTFSTQVTGSMNNLVTIQALSWLPWIAWMGLKVHHGWKYQVGFGLLILGQFWAGYPQHVLYAIALAVGLDIVNSFKRMTILKWLKDWSVTGFFTLGITTVAWWPFIEALLASTRMIQTGTQAAMGSLSLSMFPKMILPYFFDNPGAGIKWGPAWSGQPNSLFYITWIGLLGCVTTILKRFKENRGLILLLGLTLLWALGDNLPGFAAAQQLIPFLKAGRYPSMVLICSNILLILLALPALSDSCTHRSIKPLIGAALGMALISLLLWLIVPAHFSTVWLTVDSLLHRKLSTSIFHTQAKDLVISTTILNDLVLTSLFFGLALIAWFKKWRWLLMTVMGVDLIFNTQGMLFFGPKSVYPTWAQIQGLVTKPPVQTTNEAARVLIRNTNEQYTDFGAYWESLTVRQPFSDSRVDQQELNQFNHLDQLVKTQTPDWNMATQLAAIQGYTTLLPTDFARIWQQSAEPRINFIDHVELADPQLAAWSVGYYLVDNEFPDTNHQLPPPLYQNNLYKVYRLNSLPRIRFEDNQAPLFESLSENPTHLGMSFTNPGHSTLTVADRYDPNWQVQLNGATAPLININGMRQVNLPTGKINLTMNFVPRRFYQGLLVTSLFLLIPLMRLAVEMRRKIL